MDFENQELNKRRQERQAERDILKQQMKWVKLGLGITLGVTLVCCFVMLAAAKGWFPFHTAPAATEPPLVQTQPPTQAPPPETEPPVPDTVIHLVAGGDLNVTDKTVASGLTNGNYDYTKVFMDAVPVLAGGDLTVLNFEGNLYGAPYGADSAPQELVQALAKAGVDLLQTANSRSISRGLTGLRATLSGIRNAGIAPVGTFADKAEFNSTKGYTIREVSGIKIAFVAFTKGMDDLLSLPAGSESCVNLLYEDYYSTYQKINTAGIQSVLKAVRGEKPDVTVALLHWGSENNDNISKTQKDICALMQSEGVDAIIGTHSHRVQQMVFDKEKGTFVAYSLGDFLGDGEAAGSDYSVLLDLQITKSAQTGQVKITGFDYVPIYLYRDGDSMQILRIREAVQAYENNYIAKVSEETYNAMKSALSSIEKRITAKVP